MKVLVVNRALGTLFGGGEAFDLNAAMALSARGHEVTILTGRAPFEKRAAPSLPVKVVCLTTPNLRHYSYRLAANFPRTSAVLHHIDNLLFEIQALRWIRARAAFDIVQCCSLFRLPLRLLERGKQPTVSWLPGPPSRVARRLIRTLTHYENFALFTHGVTEQILAEMGLSSTVDFEVIEPGVEVQPEGLANGPNTLRDQIGVKRTDLVGVTVARLVPIKQHDVLLRAIAKAKQLGADWKWVFVGTGPLLDSLRVTATNAGLQEQIYFVGQLRPEEVHEWLNAADAFAITSAFESFSIATLEAMAHGLPVVATRVGYLPQMIRQSGAGILVDSRDVDGLAKSLVQMANPAVRTSLARQGRAYALKHTWQNTAAALEALYSKARQGIAA
jgi:glycosyltransferase involved in cell wall biosynthesis